MFCKVMAGGIHGIESFLAQVEVDAGRGMPGLEMVGLLNSEVRDVTTNIDTKKKPENKAFIGGI